MKIIEHRQAGCDTQLQNHGALVCLQCPYIPRKERLSLAEWFLTYILSIICPAATGVVKMIDRRIAVCVASPSTCFSPLPIHEATILLSRTSSAISDGSADSLWSGPSSFVKCECSQLAKLPSQQPPMAQPTLSDQRSQQPY